MSQQPKATDERAVKRIDELRSLYASSADSKKSKTLLYGEWGTYKTTIATTMPRPILWNMFDPGGEKVKHIQDGVNDNSIIVDNRFANREFVESGDQFQGWNDEYNINKRQGLYENIGTFVLDSLTSFQSLVLDASVESNAKNSKISKKMPIKVPQLRDYGVQGSAMEFALRSILSLPCHVVVIAHAETNEREDDKGNVIGRDFRPMIVGKKLAAKVPSLFDEIYITYLRGSKGRLLTQPKGMYHARSRLGSLFPIEQEYTNEFPGDFNMTRDILVPAGYASKKDIPEV